MLDIESVTRRFGSFVAVDDLSFRVAPGEIYGFLGPNGAGKTTTMKMIVGLLRPTKGRVLVDGIDVAKSPLAAKRCVGYVPDRPNLPELLTALEYMYFVGGLYGLKRSVAAPRSVELLAQFGLGHKLNHLIEGFSHGMKQRLVMASVLLHEPRLLVVDEPMVGLDPQGARLLKNMLRTQTHEKGMSVLLSTHTLDVADEVCDQLAVINHGKLVAQGKPEALKANMGGADARLEAVFLQLIAEGEPTTAR